MTQSVLSHSRSDVHRAVTEKIIAAIEVGPGTYTMPWHRSGNRLSRPFNPQSGKPYHGVNVLALWAEAVSKGYQSGHWASYRQWQALGAQVQSGERGSLVIFWKAIETEDEATTSDGTHRPKHIARGYTVFNAAQVKGWTPPEVPRKSQVDRIDAVEAVVAQTRATIREGHYDIASYDPALDQIDMPARSLFKGTATISATEAFYATLFHELTHWTGHSSRLGRDLKSRFGDAAYAIEELVAELGAAYLAADLGLYPVPRPDHAAYVADWLRVLKRDPRVLSSAAAKASAAVTYLMCDPVADARLQGNK